MSDFSSYTPRPKFAGNWKCSQCGKAITELPFEPDPSRINQLNCRDCHQKVKNNFNDNRFGNRR